MFGERLAPDQKKNLFQILNFSIIAPFQFIRLADKMNVNAEPKGLGKELEIWKMVGLGHMVTAYLGLSRAVIVCVRILTDLS